MSVLHAIHLGRQSVYVRCVASCMWSNKLLRLVLLHKD